VAQLRETLHLIIASPDERCLPGRQTSKGDVGGSTMCGAATGRWDHHSDEVAGGTLVGDGGGKAPQWPHGIIGAEKVARVLGTSLPPLARIGVIVEPRSVNGQQGAIFRDRDGRLITTWTLDILGGQIQMIRAALNPDKLRHLGPVADPWAVAREANHARRG
jgi:hypothetical protein